MQEPLFFRDTCPDECVTCDPHSNLGSNVKIYTYLFVLLTYTLARFMAVNNNI